MKAFRFSAIDPAGKTRRGLAYASDSARLRDDLIKARLQPTAIRPALLQAHRRLTLSTRDTARFARDLGQLLKGGLSTAQALALIATRETPILALIARETRTRLSAGQPLSTALGVAQGSAARFLQAMARGGEASGRQADVLAAAGRSLHANDQLRRRLTTLSVYPAFVILVALMAIGLYAYAVLPALEPAFSQLGDDIPPQTQAVLTFGAVVRGGVPVLALFAGVLAILLVLLPRLRSLGLGAIGVLALCPKRSPLRDALFSGLATRLAVLIEAGVPLGSAWRLARDPVTLTGLKGPLARQDDRLMEGVRLSAALQAVPYTPQDLIHYVALGEQSGQISTALNDAGAALGARAQEQVERALALLTPLVIILVGGLVGLITMLVFQSLLAVGDAVAS